ncbi:RNA 2',3'-cyclic phosphodiesterase [Hahella sp. KA22]|uniref:RNA 2',3'-cyclic phosphodiesterase n=1 Tax=Hahella sp. KA22 TaxID=1628392 RepID=UPI000FDEA6B0|nr:RNA 2',3'-cyclic phosphodiesterase [Hahella sp. KA22]AZZ93584.1 RNA 2',3'-cyclic phosphodiesterase [Hahella sp. KA22]QAY56959.1 RNA 2',3'-cyclic phosphodiesterase [Hahella sp. KA22]
MRCFFTLVPPASVKERLLMDIERLQTQHPELSRHYRWQSREQLHITLHFFADLDPEVAQRLVEDLRESLLNFPSFSIVFEAITPFPSIQRAGYLAAQITANDRLLALHEHIKSHITQAGEPVDERAFRPHLTLARGRSRRQRLDLRADLIAPLQFDVQAVELYQSIQGENGSIYQSQATMGLRNL